MQAIVTFPVLYGVSSKGVVKEWGIWVEKKKDHSIIFTKHGQKNGKMQTSQVVIREGKNIGRANETDHFEQAQTEAASKWKKQHDKNYTETLIDPGMGKIELKLLPMLAQKFNERKSYIVWPAYVQPKLNGVRCLVQRKGDKILYWSRKSKLYKNFNLYMDQEFLSFMNDGEILDGEMYNHGDLTFQELISAIKDEKKPDVETLKKYVKFHCYDRAVEDRSFEQRYLSWRKTVPNGVNYIRLVPTFEIDNEAHMIMRHTGFVVDGYEGSIVRSGGTEGYRFQYRDNQLQKYKDFIDEEFEIVDCKEGRGKDEGKAIFTCEAKGGTFEVRCKGTDAMREEQWQNRKKYMGKQLTVRYQTLSDDGIPIFPVGIAVRDYE